MPIKQPLSRSNDSCSPISSRSGPDPDDSAEGEGSAPGGWQHGHQLPGELGLLFTLFNSDLFFSSIVLTKIICLKEVFFINYKRFFHTV